MAKKLGALPFQMIGELAEADFIRGTVRENIRPASLDLSLTEEVWRIDGFFLPRPGERIRDIINCLDALKHDLKTPLERLVSYIAKLSESLALPQEVYAYCNPKSSSGRNHVQVRVVADGVPQFDAAAPAGFAGELWLVIEPKSFPILLSKGETLSQARFFNANTRFDEVELEIALRRDRLIWYKGRPLDYKELEVSGKDGSVILTLDLNGEITGWESITSNHVLDFSRRDYRPEDFFRPIKARNGRIHLKEGGFYILRTRESVRVPIHLACEMKAMEARLGEFRSHYAGFIDPGWGFGADGDGCGRPLVVEVRPFEDLIFRDNQPIARLRFERIIEPPSSGYDAVDTSNYRQDPPYPRLSKHFSM